MHNMDKNMALIAVAVIVAYIVYLIRKADKEVAAEKTVKKAA